MFDLGLSSTTGASARSRLAEFVYPGDPRNAGFLGKVTEVLERFYLNVEWIGSRGTFSFAIPDSGYLYLPYFLESILACRLDEHPTHVKANQYEFLYDGPGEVNPTESNNGIVMETGHRAIEIEYPATAATLKFTTSDADDAGRTVRALGYDDNNNLIQSGGVPGEEVTLINGSVNTTNLYSAVRGFQKEITQGHVTVVHNGTTPTTLATIPGFIERPTYRRYQVNGTSSDNLIAYCKRKLIPVTRDEDYIIPGNLSALKNGLMAIIYEEANDLDRSRDYMARAIQILNEEATEYRGGAVETAQVNPWGIGVSGIPRIN